MFNGASSQQRANQNSPAPTFNNAGNAVGSYRPATTTPIRCLDIDGTVGALNLFGSAFSQALRIGNNHEPVGFCVDVDGARHG